MHPSSNQLSTYSKSVFASGRIKGRPPARLATQLAKRRAASYSSFFVLQKESVLQFKQQRLRCNRGRPDLPKFGLATATYLRPPRSARGCAADGMCFQSMFLSMEPNTSSSVSTFGSPTELRKACAHPKTAVGEKMK